MDDTFRIFSCYESPKRILHFAIRGGVGGSYSRLLFLLVSFLECGVWVKMPRNQRNETEIRIAISLWLHDL